MLEVAWVRIGKIPPNKRCDKTVAYVGGLVGITLEVDLSTLNRPSSVRAKIGCRFIDKLPSSAEGVLGGRFYRFTYEVEEILVRNPMVEDTTVPVSKDEPTKHDQTPKRKRDDSGKEESRSESPGCNKSGPSRGGKTCRLLSSEKELSISSESEVDSSLLIESIAREQGVCMHENTLDVSNWLVPTKPVTSQSPVTFGTVSQDVQVKTYPVAKCSLSYAAAVSNSAQVVEVDGEVDPELKISNDYVVQLPSPDCNEEIILTPPLAPEGMLRFSKRNTQGMQENMEAKAMRLANMKDREGNAPNACKNSFAVLSNTELMSRASSMGVCIPDNDFACVDVLRELERVRGNLDEKSKLEVDIQDHDDDIFVTNGLGKSAPVNLEWLDHDETVNERIPSVKSNKKKQRRSAVKLPRPVTRSQKKILL